MGATMPAQDFAMNSGYFMNQLKTAKSWLKAEGTVCIFLAIYLKSVCVYKYR